MADKRLIIHNGCKIFFAYEEYCGIDDQRTDKNKECDLYRVMESRVEDPALAMAVVIVAKLVDVYIVLISTEKSKNGV